MSEKLISGRKIGMIILIKRLNKNKHGHWDWLFNCSYCGKESVISEGDVYKTKSCGCLVRRKGINNPRWTGYGELSGKEWNGIKNHAKNRDLNFDLNIKEVYELFLKQEKKCALTDEEISFKDKTASLDRIDSNKHYYIENIQWTHKDINRIKWDFDENYLLKIASLVANYVKYFNLNFSIPKRHKNFQGIGCITKEFYHRIENNALIRNYEVDIDINFVWNLYVEQGCRCALTGIPIYFLVGYKFGTASLDRIDNFKGYTKENVQWVHKDLNRMKMDFSVIYFTSICKKICNYKGTVDFSDMLVPSNEWHNSFDSFNSKIIGIGNAHNIPRGKTSIYKGVVFDKSRSKWISAMSFNKKRIFIGYFDSEIEAAEHYDFYAIEKYGKGNCYLNFPDKDYTNFVLKPKKNKSKKEVFNVN